MTLELTLFIFRLLTALLLLLFVGIIGWIIYQDMRQTALALSDRQRQYGSLRVIVSQESELPVGSTFPLLAVTSMGRAPGNTIVLPDHYASGEHALVTLRGQQWWLEDLDSRNGTRLNDLPVNGATVISAGDVVMVGNTHLKVEL